jgi:hypothetical protein
MLTSYSERLLAFLKQQIKLYMYQVHSCGDVLLTAYLSIYVLPSYVPPWRLRVKQFSFSKPDCFREEETTHWGVSLFLQNCKPKFIWILTVNNRFAWTLYGSWCCPIYTWPILHRKSKTMGCQNLGDLRFSRGETRLLSSSKHFISPPPPLPRLPASFMGAPSPTGPVAAPFSFLASPCLHLHRAAYSALKIEAEGSSETSVFSTRLHSVTVLFLSKSCSPSPGDLRLLADFHSTSCTSHNQAELKKRKQTVDMNVIILNWVQFLQYLIMSYELEANLFSYGRN